MPKKTSPQDDILEVGVPGHTRLGHHDGAKVWQTCEECRQPWPCEAVKKIAAES